MEAEHARVVEDLPPSSFPISDADAADLLARACKPVDLGFHPKRLFSKLKRINVSDNTKLYLGTTVKGDQVVVKKLRSRESPGLQGFVLLEIAMSFLNTHCESVVNYHSCFRTKKNWWLVMEHMAAGPVARVRAACDFGEREIAFVLRRVLLALKYLHERHRVHRDIKAHNVLINERAEVKLVDFGWATQLTEGHPNTALAVGSVFWMAPEVHAGQDYDTSADVWSVGVLALELANLEPPYYSMDHESATLLLMLGDPPKLVDARQHDWSPDMHDFVSSCLRKSPATRPRVARLLQHPFIEQAASPEEWTRFLHTAFPKWPKLRR